MAKKAAPAKVLKVIHLKVTPELMENYSKGLGKNIRVTIDTHRNSRAKSSWRGLPILVNHDELSTPLGVIADDGVVKPDGLYMSVAFTDPDALRIYEANAHKGWSIGFIPVDVDEETGNVRQYAPHHLAFVLPGHKPVCPKNVCDTVSGYTAQVAKFSFVEVPKMTEQPPTPPAEVKVEEPAAPLPTEGTAATQPAAAPEASAPDPAKVEEKPECTCHGEAHKVPATAPAPAQAPALPTKFTETEVFAMRDELAALKAAREKELAELDALRAFRSSAEQKEKTELIARIQKVAGPKAANVDFNAKPLDALREMVAILPDAPAGFSETTPPAAPAPELQVQGSGATEHNKPPAVDPKEAKLQAERVRIAALWKNVKA